MYFPAGRNAILLLPDGSHRLVSSLIRHRHVLGFGEYIWNEERVPAGPVWIRVDLQRQLISVFRSGEEIGSSVVLYGAESKPTPAGVYPVLEKAVHHHSSLYDAEMPYMLRLTGDGIAVHASEVRARSATHGCIGVPLAFARLLFDEVHRGDVVAIVSN